MIRVLIMNNECCVAVFVRTEMVVVVVCVCVCVCVSVCVCAGPCFSLVTRKRPRKNNPCITLTRLMR